MFDRLGWALLFIIALLLLATYGSLSFQLVPVTSIFLQLAPRIGVVLLTILIGKAAIELTSPVIMKVARSKEAGNLLKGLWRVGLWVIVGIVSLSILFGDVGSALLTIGIILFGLAIASRKLLTNFIGWIYIHAKEVYNVGDDVGMEGLFGTVTGIDMMTTTIFERNDGRLVNIPNRMILEGFVSKPPKDLPLIVDEFRAEFSLKTDPVKVKNFLLKVFDEIVGIKKMKENVKEYRLALQDMGVDIRVREEPVFLMEIRKEHYVMRMRYIIDERVKDDVRCAICERVVEALRKRKL